MHFNKKPNNNFHGQRPPAVKPQQPSLTKPGVGPMPARVYTDADIHVDVVDMSFNDIRKVEVGVYPDGTPKAEYVSEKQATDMGLLEQWQKALPMDEYKKSAND